MTVITYYLNESIDSPRETKTVQGLIKISRTEDCLYTDDGPLYNSKGKLVRPSELISFESIVLEEKVKLSEKLAIQGIYFKIEEACKKGESEVAVGQLSDFVIKDLKKNGYKISDIGHYLSLSKYLITW